MLLGNLLDVSMVQHQGLPCGSWQLSDPSPLRILRSESRWNRVIRYQMNVEFQRHFLWASILMSKVFFDMVSFMDDWCLLRLREHSLYSAVLAAKWRAVTTHWSQWQHQRGGEQRPPAEAGGGLGSSGQGGWRAATARRNQWQHRRRAILEGTLSFHHKSLSQTPVLWGLTHTYSIRSYLMLTLTHISCSFPLFTFVCAFPLCASSFYITIITPPASHYHSLIIMLCTPSQLLLHCMGVECICHSTCP